MKITDQFKYANFQEYIDIDAFEEAIGWEPLREAVNKRGEAEDIGHCPDPWSQHKNGDTTGKFALNRAKRLYNCFVCGGGTLLDLTMAVRDITDQEAETWLYQFTTDAGVSDEEFISEIEALLREETRAKPVTPYYNERVLDKWADQLGHAERWLQERGISDDVAVQARLGFQPDALRIPPKGKEAYSGPCMYLPHFWGERLVGWQQRWLDDDRPKWIPKYTNTSSFPKTETLYNFENIYLTPRPIIVVESVTTVLFLRSIGYPAVATFGGSVSDEQMHILRCLQQGLVLAPDNDEPGRKWTSYTEEERYKGRHERMLMADYLAGFVSVKVIEPIGEYDSGNDLGDLLDEGLPFAAEAVKMLYAEAEYY